MPPAGDRTSAEPVTKARSRAAAASTSTQAVPAVTPIPRFSPTPIASVSSSEEGPVRYRHIDDIMRDARRVELDEDDEMAMLAKAEEPSCYREAVGQPAWEEAMAKEIKSIEKNGTWTLTKLPAGHKPIDLKWVYKLKKNSYGEVIKHKARLVAKGYVQQQGINFEEVFAPVARLDSRHVILAIAANRGW